MRDFVLRGRHLFIYDVAVTTVAIVLAFLLRFDLANFGANLSTAMPAALLPLVVMPAVFVESARDGSVAKKSCTVSAIVRSFGGIGAESTRQRALDGSSIRRRWTMP